MTPMTPKLSPLDKLTSLPFPTLTDAGTTLALLRQALQLLPESTYICHALAQTCNGAFTMDLILLKAYVMDTLANMVKDLPLWPHPYRAYALGSALGAYMYPERPDFTQENDLRQAWMNYMIQQAEVQCAKT